MSYRLRVCVLHVTQQGLPVTQHNVTGYAGSDYHPRRYELHVTQAEVTGYTTQRHRLRGDR